MFRPCTQKSSLTLNDMNNGRNCILCVQATQELNEIGDNYHPVDTRRRLNVYKTSIRCRRRPIDVLQTLKRRRVSTRHQLFSEIVDSDFKLDRLLQTQPPAEGLKNFLVTEQGSTVNRTQINCESVYYHYLIWQFN